MIPYENFVPIYLYLIIEGRWNCSSLIVTFTATKPWLSRNMLPNINTRENGWLNFYQIFESWHSNLSNQLNSYLKNYQFTFISYVQLPLSDVIKRTRFRMSSSVTTLHFCVSCLVLFQLWADCGNRQYQKRRTCGDVIKRTRFRMSSSVTTLHFCVRSCLVLFQLWADCGNRQYQKRRTCGGTVPMYN